jgi:hypothetical protein
MPSCDSTADVERTDLSSKQLKSLYKVVLNAMCLHSIIFSDYTSDYIGQLSDHFNYNKAILGSRMDT